MAQERSAPQSHFRDWLRISGCLFARHFGASDERLVFVEAAGSAARDVANIEAFFDGAGAAHRVAVVLCPRLRSPDEVAGLIGLLAGHPRWQVALHAAAARITTRSHFA